MMVVVVVVVVVVVMIAVQWDWLPWYRDLKWASARAPNDVVEDGLLWGGGGGLVYVITLP